MANDACWDMRVVAKSKEAIERLFRIMKYGDDEFFMYRVLEAWHSQSGEEWIDNEDGYYVADLWGEVAWAADAWVDPDESRHKMYECVLETHPRAKYATLLELCPALDIGVELYCAEPMCDVRQHFAVAHDGTLTVDEDGNEFTEPVWEGGVDKDEGIPWLTPEQIYEGKT